MRLMWAVMCDAPLVDGGIPIVLDGYGSGNGVAEEDE
jgi:hypothetical protein